ncbi:MAG: hypothetical protein RCG16_04730 [Rickettsia hoogstraalii]
MQRRNGGGNVIHTGNLEFTNYGKVKFHKDFTGDITTSKINRGEVTFVNTPDIYGVGALNKRIEKLVFTGNHRHNLHKDIHAARTEFDAGTYNIHTNPITIDGNANINGSTFDLRHDLIFTGNVELSNNIRINSAGNRVIFQNYAPTVNNAGANITFNINGAPPANEAAVLAVLHINVGGVVFPPVGSRYDVGTATLILPGLGGAQVQQQQQQAQAQQQGNGQGGQPQMQQNQQQAQQNQQGQGQGQDKLSKIGSKCSRTSKVKLSKISSKCSRTNSKFSNNNKCSRTSNSSKLKLSARLMKELDSKDYKRNVKKMLEESSNNNSKKKKEEMKMKD